MSNHNTEEGVREANFGGYWDGCIHRRKYQSHLEWGREEVAHARGAFHVSCKLVNFK